MWCSGEQDLLGYAGVTNRSESLRTFWLVAGNFTVVCLQASHFSVPEGVTEGKCLQEAVFV